MSYLENSKVQESQAQGGNLWLAVKRNWLISLLVTLGVFSLPAYKAVTKKPIFQSSAIILVGNQTSVPVAEDTTGGNTTSQPGNDLSTEIEILKSPALLTRVLKNLPMSHQSMETWQIAEGLSLQQNPNTRVLMISYTNVNPQITHEVLKALVKTYVDYSRESRRSPVTSSIRFIEGQLPEARLKLEKTSAQLTKFRQTYNLDALDTAAATAQQNREGLQNQINTASMQLAQTKRLAQQLMQQAPNVNLDVNTLVNDTVLSQDTTYQNLLNQLRTLDSQYALETTRLQPLHPALEDLRERRDETRLLLQAQVQRVIGSRRSQAATNTTVSGIIQQDIGTRLLEAQNNIAVQSAQLNSLRQAEKQAIKKLQQILSLQQTYRELQREYALNSRAVDNFLGRLQEFKIREAQDTNSWKVLEWPNFPMAPIPNNLLGSLLIGLVQGAIAGVGVAFLLEKLDRRIKGVQEVKDLTGLPVLGSLPKVSQKALAASGYLPSSSHKDDLLSESARSIALALQFQQILGMVQQKGKIFVVTSADAGEGKTTVTQNLGINLSELGRRVLIVDANLSDPALHKRFGIGNQDGLATTLSTNQSWQSFIQPIFSKQMAIAPHLNGHSNPHYSTPIPEVDRQLDFFSSETTAKPFTNWQERGGEPDLGEGYGTATLSPLNVLPSGMVGPQPVIWLASPKMPQLLEQWRHAYDCILIDTPSMNDLADVQCLIPYVDGVILTVGLKRATRQLLTRTLGVLQTIEAKVTGLVINFCPQAEMSE
jgi:polysaccharide biosynthesis transport protein